MGRLRAAYGPRVQQFAGLTLIAGSEATTGAGRRNTSAVDASRTSSIDELVAAEALALAFRRLPVSILMACVIGFTFVAMLGPFFPTERICVWLAVMVSVYLARYLIWRAWKQAIPGP